MSDHRELIHVKAHERSTWMFDLVNADNWQNCIDSYDDPEAPESIKAQELLDEYGEDTHWSEHVLEVDVLRGENGRFRVEFLLSCGATRSPLENECLTPGASLLVPGPTERVIVDSRLYYAVYFHSWGKTSADVNRTDMTMSDADSEVWIQLAEEVTES